MFDESIYLPAILEVLVILGHFLLIEGLSVDVHAVLRTKSSKFVSFLRVGKFLH